MKYIYNGDAIKYSIKLEANNTLITAGLVDDVEVIIGNIKKSYAEGTLEWNAETERWIFPMTQEESFKLPVEMPLPAQVRVKFADGHGTTRGKIIPNIITIHSLSQEIL